MHEIDSHEIDSIDTHRLFCDGALLLFEQRGDFTLAHAERATTVYSQVIAQEGYILILIDFTHAQKVAPETRRHLAHWGKANCDQIAIAAVGGSFLTRTTLTLVVTAIKVLGGRQPDIGFFGNRKQAKTWLQAHAPALSSHRRMLGSR